MKIERGIAGFFQLINEFGISFENPILFDVGANEGQFIDKFASRFGEIEVHAFEPTKLEYLKLRDKYSLKSNYYINHCALSSLSGVAELIEHDNSKLNFITSNYENSSTRSQVELVTGDYYISKRHLEKVDFLKIDTEGHDFEVLKGFESTLKKGCIRMIQVEVGLCPENGRHASLELVKEWLESYGYRLFYVHEFAWMGNKERFMRRFDAIFVLQKSEEKKRLF